MSDWLDTEEPATAGLPAVVAIPDDFAARVVLADRCWSALTVAQKTFLSALRECRFNARAAARHLGVGGANGHYGRHYDWMREQDYATVVRVWRANAAANALDRDRLLARQDDIVETLLTPKPILHQGSPTGFEEVEASAAARANETLMTAAGILKSGKDTEVNVNVGIAGPGLSIQVMPLPPSKNAEQPGVSVALPEPAPIDAEFVEVMPPASADTSVPKPVASPAQDWMDA